MTYGRLFCFASYALRKISTRRFGNNIWTSESSRVVLTVIATLWNVQSTSPSSLARTELQRVIDISDATFLAIRRSFIFSRAASMSSGFRDLLLTSPLRTENIPSDNFLLLLSLEYFRSRLWGQTQLLGLGSLPSFVQSAVNLNFMLEFFFVVKSLFFKWGKLAAVLAWILASASDGMSLVLSRLARSLLVAPNSQTRGFFPAFSGFGLFLQ